MSSNNPFASALKAPDAYTNRREPPPVPQARTQSNTPPARPPKSDSALPPSYEEAAGTEKSRREYPREKLNSSSSRQQSSSRRHRSHSDTGSGGRHSRSHKDKDRERRHRSKKTQPEPVKAKNLDTIDKLDVTAFFGGGFHHDGPFDACTPHRNKNVKAAPVMAFPADGPNSSIKGAGGNIDKDEQLNLAFGNYDGSEDQFVGKKSPVRKQDDDNQVPLIKTNRKSNDVPTSLFTPKHNPSVINFDANMKAEPIHGSTTAGLGSSTFIDGAPAPKSANDDQFLSVSGGGLGRKKSLVQRLRKNSGSESSSRRSSNDYYERDEDRRDSTGGFDDNIEGAGNSLLRRVKSLKVGRK